MSATRRGCCQSGLSERSTLMDVGWRLHCISMSFSAMFASRSARAPVVRGFRSVSHIPLPITNAPLPTLFKVPSSNSAQPTSPVAQVSATVAIAKSSVSALVNSLRAVLSQHAKPLSELPDHLSDLQVDAVEQSCQEVLRSLRQGDQQLTSILTAALQQVPALLFLNQLVRELARADYLEEAIELAKFIRHPFTISDQWKSGMGTPTKATAPFGLKIQLDSQIAIAHALLRSGRTNAAVLVFRQLMAESKISASSSAGHSSISTSSTGKWKQVQAVWFRTQLSNSDWTDFLMELVRLQEFRFVRDLLSSHSFATSTDAPPPLAVYLALLHLHAARGDRSALLATLSAALRIQQPNSSVFDVAIAAMVKPDALVNSDDSLQDAQTLLRLMLSLGLEPSAVLATRLLFAVAQSSNLTTISNTMDTLLALPRVAADSGFYSTALRVLLRHQSDPSCESLMDSVLLKMRSAKVSPDASLTALLAVQYFRSSGRTNLDRLIVRAGTNHTLLLKLLKKPSTSAAVRHNSVDDQNSAFPEVPRVIAKQFVARRVFVQHLSNKTNVASLTSYLSQFGTVDSVQIHSGGSGRSKWNLATVLFSSALSAQKLMQQPLRTIDRHVTQTSLEPPAFVLSSKSTSSSVVSTSPTEQRTWSSVDGCLLLAQTDVLFSRYIDHTALNSKFGGHLLPVQHVWSPIIRSLLVFRERHALPSLAVLDGILSTAVRVGTVHSKTTLSAAVASLPVLLQVALWTHSEIRPLSARSFHSFLLAARAGGFEEPSEAFVDLSSLRLYIDQLIPLRLPSSVQRQGLESAHPWKLFSQSIVSLHQQTEFCNSRFEQGKLIIECMLRWNIRPDDASLALWLDTTTTDSEVEKILEVMSFLRIIHTESALLTSRLLDARLRTGSSRSALRLLVDLRKSLAGSTAASSLFGPRINMASADNLLLQLSVLRALAHAPAGSVWLQGTSRVIDLLPSIHHNRCNEVLAHALLDANLTQSAGGAVSEPSDQQLWIERIQNLSSRLSASGFKPVDVVVQAPMHVQRLVASAELCVRCQHLPAVASIRSRVQIQCKQALKIKDPATVKLLKWILSVLSTLPVKASTQIQRPWLLPRSSSSELIDQLLSNADSVDDASTYWPASLSSCDFKSASAFPPESLPAKVPSRSCAGCGSTFAVRDFSHRHCVTCVQQGRWNAISAVQPVKIETKPEVWLPAPVTEFVASHLTL